MLLPIQGYDQEVILEWKLTFELWIFFIQEFDKKYDKNVFLLVAINFRTLQGFLYCLAYLVFFKRYQIDVLTIFLRN